MQGYGDPVWEELFATQSWGKYPSEEVIRFYFYAASRINARPLRALDLGCGKGAVSWFMKHEGADVTAMDGAPSGIANVPVLAASFGVTEKIHTVLGDITRPAEHLSDSYHLIIDHYALYANPKNRIVNALAQIRKLLSPGGYFLTCVFGTNTDGFGTGVEQEPGFYCNLTSGVLAGRGGVSFFTAEELRKTIEQAGMQVKFEESILQCRDGSAVEKLICYAGI